MLKNIEKLVQPGMRVMRRLQLPLKFALVSTAFMVPLGVALYAVIGYANAGIDFANSELRGTTYLKLTNPLLSRTTLHGDDAAALRQQIKDDGDALKINAAVSSLSGSGEQRLADRWVELYGNIGDNSGLILDPDLDSFYTMVVAVDYGPKLIAASTALAQHLNNSAVDPATQADMRYLQTTVRVLQASIHQAMQRAAQANPSLTSKLSADEWQQSVTKLRSAVDAKLSGDAAVNHSNAASEVSAQTLRLMDAHLGVLTTLLQQRSSGFAARRNGILLLALGCLLLSAYLVTSFYMSDRCGFAALKSRMDKLASGDLTVNHPARGRDEIGALINSFNDTRARLQVLVERIHQAADSISTAGSEISSANMDLANRSSSQAAVIDETATRVRQVTDKVQANLKAAGHANQIARDAHGAANNGKLVVDSVVATMDAMSGSSKRIGAIIDVINEIAFQTNLLALNAAVEAARAGEQGRGFAVVAGEVRNLAQRCATAASEITQLIKASVTDVDTGVGQVAKAGSSMNEILEAVGSVSGIMGEMTEASKAQIHAITGIDSAVGKINADAQQNAAIVEQTASAAALLHEQVGVLVESVGHFTFGSERDTPAAAHSPPHATTVAATPARRVA